MKPGEEGRGGKVLLKDAADEGLLYASFEILGMAEWTESGIVTIHPDNISYNDNSDYKRNWSAMLTGDTWELLYEWLEENRSRMEEMQKFSSWRDIFDEIGGSYERVWSDEELKQRHLNN